MCGGLFAWPALPPPHPSSSLIPLFLPPVPCLLLSIFPPPPSSILLLLLPTYLDPHTCRAILVHLGRQEIKAPGATAVSSYLAAGNCASATSASPPPPTDLLPPVRTCENRLAWNLGLAREVAYLKRCPLPCLFCVGESDAGTRGGHACAKSPAHDEWWASTSTEDSRGACRCAR